MQCELTEVLYENRAPESLGCTMGTVVDISVDGHVKVDFEDNSGPPRRALLLTGSSNERTLGGLKEGDAVLLTFVNGTQPVVMGILSSKLEVPQKNEQPIARVHEGREIVLNAKDQLSLVCGDSSITLNRNGKIVVKGTHIVSRATQTNRIKGGSVAIN